MKISLSLKAYVLSGGIWFFSINAMEDFVQIEQGLETLAQYAVQSRKIFSEWLSDFDIAHNQLSDKIVEQLGPIKHPENKIDFLQKTFLGRQYFSPDSILKAVENDYYYALHILLGHKSYAVHINHQQGEEAPLVCAVVKKNLPVVRLLLKYGANPYEPSSANSALNQAALLPLRYGILQAFLNRSVNLNIHDRSSNTVLMHAAQSYDLEKVKILLKNGADPNIQDLSGRTVLHHVYQWFAKTNYKNINLRRIIELLKRYGADDKILSIDGKSPYDVEVY